MLCEKIHHHLQLCVTDMYETVANLPSNPSSPLYFETTYPMDKIKIRRYNEMNIIISNTKHSFHLRKDIFVQVPQVDTCW